MSLKVSEGPFHSNNLEINKEKPSGLDLSSLSQSLLALSPFGPQVDSPASSPLKDKKMVVAPPNAESKPTPPTTSPQLKRTTQQDYDRPVRDVSLPFTSKRPSPIKTRPPNEKPRTRPSLSRPPIDFKPIQEELSSPTILMKSPTSSSSESDSDIESANLMSPVSSNSSERSSPETSMRDSPSPVASSSSSRYPSDLKEDFILLPSDAMVPPKPKKYKPDPRDEEFSILTNDAMIPPKYKLDPKEEGFILLPNDAMASTLPNRKYKPDRREKGFIHLPNDAMMPPKKSKT